MEFLSLKRKTIKKLHQKNFLSKILIFIGTVFVLLSLTHRVLKNRSLFAGNFPSNINSNQLKRVGEIPSHLYIEGKVDVDIVESKPNIFDVPEKKAVFLIQSSVPNENGNIIIYGHNKNSILGNIRYLSGKERIVLTTTFGSRYSYSIEEIKEVSPSETKYLEQTRTETLTIYTCSGFLDKNRFIVRAKRIQL